MQVEMLELAKYRILIQRSILVYLVILTSTILLAKKLMPVIIK